MAQTFKFYFFLCDLFSHPIDYDFNIWFMSCKLIYEKSKIFKRSVIA